MFFSLDSASVTWVTVTRGIGLGAELKILVLVLRIPKPYTTLSIHCT
jgi:hypothetical protein